MTLAELARELAAIEHLLDHRVEIWRVILDADGHVVRRLYRGSFTNNSGG